MKKRKRGASGYIVNLSMNQGHWKRCHSLRAAVKGGSGVAYSTAFLWLYSWDHEGLDERVGVRRGSSGIVVRKELDHGGSC